MTASITKSQTGYDYGKHVNIRMIKITPICFFKDGPHYHCTSQVHEQDECMYYEHDIDGWCVHASGVNYTICKRRRD